MANPRLRNRFITGISRNVQGYYAEQEFLSEFFFESNTPGSNNCQSRLIGLPSFRLTRDDMSPSQYDVQYSNYGYFHYQTLYDYIYENLDSHPMSLNWDKLPTSSKFGLIQLFAELDDTLALFTKRFWSSLTYGSFTWGVLPFVSEVKALLQSICNLAIELDSFSYEDEYDVPCIFTKDFQYYTLSFSGSCLYRYTGLADLSFMEDSLVWLDRLGFHPDLATAWDLVPLSFVFDWLLPVGDFLESFRGGGWINTVMFYGWETSHITGEFSLAFKSPYVGRAVWSLHEFRRNSKSDLLQVNPDGSRLPDLRIPSLKQLFGMLYIFVLSKK